MKLFMRQNRSLDGYLATFDHLSLWPCFSADIVIQWGEAEGVCVCVCVCVEGLS